MPSDGNIQHERRHRAGRTAEENGTAVHEPPQDDEVNGRGPVPAHVRLTRLKVPGLADAFRKDHLDTGLVKKHLLMFL